MNVNPSDLVDDQLDLRQTVLRQLAEGVATFKAVQDVLRHQGMDPNTPEFQRGNSLSADVYSIFQQLAAQTGPQHRATQSPFQQSPQPPTITSLRNAPDAQDTLLRPRDFGQVMRDHPDTCIVRPPPQRGAALSGGLSATQYLHFTAAMRAMGGEYITNTPFDLGQGKALVTPNDTKHAAGWPGPWPAKDHNPHSIKHHFFTWLQKVCHWTQVSQADPEQVLQHAIRNIMDLGEQNLIRAHMEGTPATVSRVDALYDAVLTVAHGDGLHPTYSELLPRVIGIKIMDAETVLQFYARFLHTCSLMINAVDYDYKQPLSPNQLKAAFISGLIDRPFLESALTHDLHAHPRRQYQEWDLWPLAWVNHQHTASVQPEAYLQHWPRGVPSQIPAFNAVAMERTLGKRPAEPTWPSETTPEKVARQGVHPNRDITPPADVQQGRGANQQLRAPPHSPGNPNFIPLGQPAPQQHQQPHTPRQGRRTGRRDQTPRREVPEYRDYGVTPHSELTGRLKPVAEAVKTWRTHCFAKENKGLTTALLKEVPAAVTAAENIKTVAERLGVTAAFCWQCRRWGHDMNSTNCPFRA